MSKLLRISKHGQFVIPAEFRRKWGFYEGEYASLEETDEGLIIRPIVVTKTRVSARTRQNGVVKSRVKAVTQ